MHIGQAELLIILVIVFLLFTGSRFSSALLKGDDARKTLNSRFLTALGLILGLFALAQLWLRL